MYTESKSEQYMQPYKFSATATAIMPVSGVVAKLYFKLIKGEPLTREQKNYLFHELQSNSGKQNYRVLGWVFPFGQFFKTYLVKYNHDDNKWTEIKAPDKTAIRNSYYTKFGIIEILEKPGK